MRRPVHLAEIDWTRFPAKLTRARECAGLSLGQAARVAGIARDRLKAFEDGRARPLDVELDLVVGAYDVLVSWLLSLPPYDL